MVRIINAKSHADAKNTFTVDTVDADIVIMGTTITHPTTDYNVLQLMGQYEAFFSEEIQDLADTTKAVVKINGIKTSQFHPFRVASKSMKMIVDADYDTPMPITSSAWEAVVLAAEFKSEKMIINMSNTSWSPQTMWIRAKWSTTDNKKFLVPAGSTKSFNVESDIAWEIEIYTSDKDNSSSCVTSKMCDHH